MHRVTLLTIGRLKETWAREACAQYTERLRSGIDLQIVEMAPSHGRSAAEQQIEESQRLLVALQKTPGAKIILDERGKFMTSPGFASFIASAHDRGEPLVFVLGGAYGLTDAVRKAGTVLKLSDMTLPHELCRVLFLEQLYRSCEINRGSGYHHA